MTEHRPLDATDRAIINALQGEFPLTPRPYAEAALWSLGCLAALFNLRFALRLPLMKRRIH